MEEIWKDIKFIDTDGKEYDYSGLYQVSNLGRVRSLGNDKGRKEKILKLGTNNKGYLNVRLSKNRECKWFLVHRLVATMFIPNPDKLPIVNHLDENPSNCNMDNLEWCTQKYNLNYGTCQKRKGVQKKVICLETKQVFGSLRDAEKWCGKTGVGMCCKGKTNKCGGYHWQFLEDYKRELRLQSDINNSKLVA